MKTTLIYIVIALASIFVAFPYFYMFYSSFLSNENILTGTFAPSLEQFLTNYTTILYGLDFTRYLGNSAIVVPLTVAAALILSFPASYAFSRARFRGSKNLLLFILSTRFMPVAAIVYPFFIIIYKLNLLDTYVGLAIPYIIVILPYVIWILKTFIDQIPKEFDEAARVDGASTFAVLTRIILPLTRTGLLATAIIAGIFLWNEFFIGQFIVSTPNSETVAVASAGLANAEYPTDWNNVVAAGMITVAPIILFTLIVQKYIVRGLAFGAVKR